MKKIRTAACLILVAVLLSGCSQYSGNYNQGIEAFENGDYAEAAEIFDRCDPSYGNAATYALYSHGLVLWEKGMYAEAKPYFEQTQSFMYGAKRYQYCSAWVLCQDGSYDEAAEIFLSLEDFEDAAQQYQYCLGCAGEKREDYAAALAGFENAGNVNDAQDRLLNLQTRIYSKALELMNAGNTAEALPLFNVLGDYLNAEAYALQCRNVDRDALYSEADSKEAAGKLEEAYRIFVSLGSYRDATKRASDLAAQLGIPVVDETTEE